MSSRATTDIDICSRALILIGAEPITSFSDDSNEALIASNMYEDMARAMLTSTRWRFATNQAVLNRLSAAPTGRYDAAYQLPSDWLLTHVVTENDYPIEYQTYGKKLFCDAASTSTLVLDYTYRPDEADWPSYFIVALEYELASMFAASLARDNQLAQLMDSQARLKIVAARNIDAQQQTTRKLTTNRFIVNRRT